MEQELSREVDLHSVKRVAEVRVGAVNELLEAGWILHDIYFCSVDGDYRCNYVLLSLTEPTCPSCGASAKLEVLDKGERVRYVCTTECAYPKLEREPAVH